MTIACTYAPLPEVIGCDVWTKEEMDTMTDAGKLFFFFDGEKVKLGRGINSLVTTIQGKGVSFQKIKLVDLMDMMYDDIRTTAQDHYLGKYANSYANRCLLVTAIQGYLDQLAQEGLLEQGQNTAYIDVESTKIWLASKWQIYERGTGGHVGNGHQAGQHRQQCLHRRRCFAPGCHGRCHDCRQYLRR